MCGIGGFSLHPNEKIDANQLAKTLLLGIEHRGRDATGAAWWSPERVHVQKDALKATDFVKFLELPRNARTAVLHTRAQTKGTNQNCDNNHPVITGGIVGVHNGGIYNDDTLFTRMDIEDRRIGVVDTEAVFAAIAYGQEINGKTKKPRLAETLPDVLATVRGSAAIAWLDIAEGPDTLNLARLQTSPLVWAQTKIGSYLFASTEETLEKAAKEQGFKLDFVKHATEGSLMKIRSGRLDVMAKIPTVTYSTYSNTTTKPTTTHLRPSASSPAVSTSPKPDAEKEEFSDDIQALLALGMEYEAVNHVLSSTHLERMESGPYFGFYEAREATIEQYIQEGREENPNTIMDIVRANHGFCRPGTWVYTSFGDLDNLEGQLVVLPDEFPDGDYIIKLYVPNTRYPSGYEPVLVSRTSYEFEVK